MNIVPLHKVPNKTEAQSIVRELVAKGMICWSKHAKERMNERNINIQQVLTCLAKGKVTDNPVLANKGGSAGGYEITVERFTAGDHLRVVVCLKYTQTALIVTAIKI